MQVDRQFASRGAQRGDSTAADIVIGEAQPGDEVRDK
jgi:hypothetical protein